MKRREFLVLSAGTLGGVLVYSLDRKALHAASQTQAVRVPLLFFKQDEALAVAALTARIFPKDESGPGAREAGVVVFIDRQLAGPYGVDRYRYTKPPFIEGPRELGYQGQATPQQVYRENLKPLLGIDQRSEAEQDNALRAIQSTPFFELLRTHTIEGMFSDPIHGGNADMIGWQMIGFPGPRPSNLVDIDQHYGEVFRPKAGSLRDFYGDSYRPLEDER
jgi:gluconate 2-dehydrogenase gamma chain